MLEDRHPTFENRIGILEQRVAEHEIRLETACASLEKVADRLDTVCQNLAKLVGEEAGRKVFVHMWIGATVTTLLGIISYIVIE